MSENRREAAGDELGPTAPEESLHESQESEAPLPGPRDVLQEYLSSLAISCGIFGVLYFFWADRVPFTIRGLLSLWHHNPDILGGLAAVWFIFVWGAALKLLLGVLFRRRPREYTAGEVFRFGMWVSLNAGVFEEIIFRWLRFIIAMIALPFINFLLLGFLPGFAGVLHWAYGKILVPAADFVTFGALHEWLYHPASWVIGAAIISANGQFRGAHDKNGLLNSINSWFLGMVMFWLMFNYGLLTAIAAHVLYDVIVFAVGALTTSWRPLERPTQIATEPTLNQP